MWWKERNKSCECWSLKKQKHCHDKSESENDCISFLIKNKERYIKLIQQHLDSVILEVSALIKSLENDQNSIRSRFILVFSVLDTFSNLWFIFLGETTLSDTKKWEIWFDRFIVNPENSSYKKWKDLCWIDDIDWWTFYKLRSSLTHFFWIPRKSRIVLLPLFDKEWIKKLGKANSYAVDPQILLRIVIDACKLMIDDMNDKIISNDYINLQNLKKLYLEVKKNWWNRVELTP